MPGQKKKNPFAARDHVFPNGARISSFTKNPFAARDHLFPNGARISYFKLNKDFSRHMSESHRAGPTHTYNAILPDNRNNTAPTVPARTERPQQNNTSLLTQQNSLLEGFVDGLRVSAEIAQSAAASTLSPAELGRLSNEFIQFKPVSDEVSQLEKLRQKFLLSQLQWEQLCFFCSRRNRPSRSSDSHKTMEPSR